MLTLLNCTTPMKNTQKKITRSKHAILPPDTAHLQAVSENVQSMYTVFVSTNIEGTKKFYMQWFGYSIVFESTWFLLLKLPGASQAMLAFIEEDHPSSPPSPKAFSGNGAFLTIDVSDATKVYHAFKNAGADFAYHLKDELWGQKRFAIYDPNGLWIDIVQQTTPEQGWWDKYIKANE
jgi:catechol 2,3-dioxygenase-like lactoylglutathione lyase family enzyme